ncbi:uncharacterized protein LACBIDRAFT_311146 [Laccaria bicolor S238N-H82]|uniref:Predicted protein n=1 Tax=Laccaria bicolor (strain S238N-H82 / ATCC MYA-4686) TaxID=486041 RepID=B0CZC3_LACBS|nr:uncharacterized protein LACBIDRAFT_311146 [Laccaria bicolor S238N-H82]EDR12596.1 predicted protein [Laccaria bicolor S238N-H82]|eukprot:XP_001876860.1 predicted protein [Laccaria bicolor S238N-H82]
MRSDCIGYALENPYRFSSLRHPDWCLWIDSGREGRLAMWTVYESLFKTPSLPYSPMIDPSLPRCLWSFCNVIIMPYESRTCMSDNPSNRHCPGV